MGKDRFFFQMISFVYVISIFLSPMFLSNVPVFNCSVSPNSA